MKPTPVKVVHHRQAIEGVLIRDLWVGSDVDYFKTETVANENGVAGAISLATLVYQASTPVMLASEVHMSDGQVLGYFMVGGRQPMLLGDLKAFKPMAWDDLMRALEAQHLKDQQELQAAEAQYLKELKDLEGPGPWTGGG